MRRWALWRSAGGPKGGYYLHPEHFVEGFWSAELRAMMPPGPVTFKTRAIARRASYVATRRAVPVAVEVGVVVTR